MRDKGLGGRSYNDYNVSNMRERKRAQVLMTEKSSSVAPSPRRRRRKEARPSEIIEAGLQEFALRGFSATRLEDVARRAGIAKGTIYLYFPDKETLLLAVVQSRVAPVLDQIGGYIDGYHGPTRALLEQALRIVHAKLVTSEFRPIMRIIIGEGENFPALTDLYYRESVAKGRALIERIIARGLARGEIRPGPAADLPLVVMAPAIMSSIWQMTFQKHAPIAPEAFLAAHLDLIFEGILAR